MTTGAHRRKDLLTGDWVLVSPHRLDRPWHGSIEGPVQLAISHDPHCGLCPGNTRASGAQNPHYTDMFVFDNDFPALLAASMPPPADPMLQSAPETGVCRVLCYAPEHNMTLSQLAPQQLRNVIECWIAQYEVLAARTDIAAVTIFENRGEMMGASNAHPHGQIWATSSVPSRLAQEVISQRAYYDRHARPLLQDYLARELDEGERIVFQNEHVVVLVPYWATWPFETLVLPRRALSSLADWSDPERSALAEALSALTRAYDRLFATPFPYTMGWHQRPTADERGAPHFVAHAHFYPPLLRSATIRKHMVGFELLAMAQRDLTPEVAAARLQTAVAASQS